VPALSTDARPEENAIVLPSGDHLGAPGLHASPTSSRGVAAPSVEVIQIDGTRLLRARSTRETTYATCFPSGEMRGSAAKRYEK
jgi:hypothetical protein